MDPAIPYVACVVGAAAVYLLLRPGTRAVKIAAIVLGLGAVAWLLVQAATVLLPDVGDDQAIPRPAAMFLIFSLIAIASAVRMITHARPVYSALYFVMVVLSSAGLFLLLEAEFMAFALVIVYAGAILITYMFVLMLAQQAPTADDAPTSQPEYDRIPREPGMAAAVGFLMLALFTHMIFTGGRDLPTGDSQAQANERVWASLNSMPRKVNEVLELYHPGAVLAEGAEVRMVNGEPTIDIVLPGWTESQPWQLPADAMPDNISRVGLDLVAVFPVSLELAGIILLLAMFGAVVLARKQIELGEDEVREAAGMRRLGFHSDEAGGDR